MKRESGESSAGKSHSSQYQGETSTAPTASGLASAGRDVVRSGGPGHTPDDPHFNKWPNSGRVYKPPMISVVYTGCGREQTYRYEPRVDAAGGQQIRYRDGI